MFSNTQSMFLSLLTKQHLSLLSWVSCCAQYSNARTPLLLYKEFVAQRMKQAILLEQSCCPANAASTFWSLTVKGLHKNKLKPARGGIKKVVAPAGNAGAKEAVMQGTGGTMGDDGVLPEPCCPHVSMKKKSVTVAAEILIAEVVA